MQENLSQSLRHILKHEGGYVDHPHDPGGATNYGITHNVLANYRNKKVTKSDVKALTKKEAEAIYKKLYWATTKCDDLPSGLDFAVFDCAVNQGVSRAKKFLQQAARVKADGIIGPITLKAIQSTPPTKLLNEFIARRMWHYGRLARLFKTFGLGWSRRLTTTHTIAIQMLIPHRKEKGAPQ